MDLQKYVVYLQSPDTLLIGYGFETIFSTTMKQT